MRHIARNSRVLTRFNPCCPGGGRAARRARDGRMDGWSRRVDDRLALGVPDRVVDRWMAERSASLPAGTQGAASTTTTTTTTTPLAADDRLASRSAGALAVQLRPS
eukprot:scaffold1741_cov409-Prasinococcus_capsulatus_cf.AAC.5